MKKTIFTFVILSILPYLMMAQIAKELHLKSLGDVGKKNKLLIYSSTEKKFQKESIINGREITHFEPTKVTIDSIWDTIYFDTNYYDGYTREIIGAYLNPGKPYYQTSSESNKIRKWLGFWIIKNTTIDTLKIEYSQKEKNVEISFKEDKSTKSGLNHWLLGAWIMFIVCLLILKFLSDNTKTKKYIGEKTMFSDSTPESFRVLVFVIYTFFLLSSIRIVFSYSILLLILIGILFFLYTQITKKKEIKK